MNMWPPHTGTHICVDTHTAEPSCMTPVLLWFSQWGSPVMGADTLHFPKCQAKCFAKGRISVNFWHMEVILTHLPHAYKLTCAHIHLYSARALIVFLKITSRANGDTSKNTVNQLSGHQNLGWNILGTVSTRCRGRHRTLRVLWPSYRRIRSCSLAELGL